MRRRNVILGAGLVLTGLTGCMGQSDDSTTSSTPDPTATTENTTIPSPTPTVDPPESIAEQYDCADATRPTPDIEPGIGVGPEPTGENSESSPRYESVGRAEYPSPPESTTEENLRSFAQEHEVVFHRNELVRRHQEQLIDYDARINATTVINRYERIQIVRVDFSFGYGIVNEEGILSEGQGRSAAVYAIDEIGVVRAETEHQDHLSNTDSIADHTPNPLQKGELVACFT